MEIEELYFRIKTVRKRWFKKIIFVFAFLFFIFPLTIFFSHFFVTQAPDDFLANEVFEIKKGMTVTEISNFLEEKKIIRSASTFKAYDYYKKYLNEGKSNIKSGHYLFATPLNIFEVYSKLEDGKSGIKETKITILEGEPNFSIAKKFAVKFKKINEENFLEKAKKYEGYLYPDTYTFSPYDINEDLIIKIMNENFLKKTKKIREKINKSANSLEKIIIMAALIEKEAGSASSKIKKQVAGVLWRRISINMPLQVDAVFDYIYKKHLKVKLYSHLEIESPYNTYKHRGLTPTPIGNPSLRSIEAAFTPNSTNNLFYLTGKDGKFYFSKTLEQHNIYKNKYITNYKKDK